MTSDNTLQTDRPVRTRLAPSPTGYLHIGHAFLAVVGTAFARQHGGQYLIRIEDTDQTRFVPEAEQAIYDGLRWLGLTWDEGPDTGGPYAPYRQSERRPMYQAAAEDLIARGRAYRCWCSPERLTAMRQDQQARKLPPQYDRLCLGKTETERKHLPGYTERSVVRLLMPDGQTTFEDALRGPISFENALLDDRVLLKSDGFPTYNLAAPYDDHAMGITHIFRGEEWIPSTPAHLQIFDAFGWDMPVLAHLPLLLNEDRSKISKRRHPWAKITYFQEEGYLPQAVLNYLGGLAVHVPDPDNPDPSVDRELFGFDDICQHLDLTRIGRAGKIVDLNKLTNLNGHYIRRLPLDELQTLVEPYMAAAGLAIADHPTFPDALALEHERLKRLAEAPQVLSFFFREEDYDARLLVPKGADQDRARVLLQAALDTARQVAGDDAGWTAAALEAAYRHLAEILGLNTGKLRGQLIGAGVVRVAVTGRAAGPPLFETMEVLGAETCLQRMAVALSRLEATWN